MKTLLFSVFLLLYLEGFSQSNPPWERPLKMAWSNDGTTFANSTVFQDSSGVPNVIKWKGDTLVCVFQWFRQPINSSSWDKVAVKFSYDGGISWTKPTPIIVNGMPLNYQRPFDPTLAVISKNILRVYFSSSNGMPAGGLSSIVDTYSASGPDGVNYTFEPDARFDSPDRAVIDPAIIYFNGLWHYESPAGAPQDGAFHCTGADGLNFTRQANYTSDNFHNWLGNYVLNSPSELRFYGSGQKIWFNSSADGFTWQGYIGTNLTGGDPSVVKTSDNRYLIIYVGEAYSSGTEDDLLTKNNFRIYPNPFTDRIKIKNGNTNSSFEFINTCGKPIYSGKDIEGQDFSNLYPGIYFLRIIDEKNNHLQTQALIKQ